MDKSVVGAGFEHGERISCFRGGGWGRGVSGEGIHLGRVVKGGTPLKCGVSGTMSLTARSKGSPAIGRSSRGRQSLGRTTSGGESGVPRGRIWRPLGAVTSLAMYNRAIPVFAFCFCLTGRSGAAKPRRSVYGRTGQIFLTVSKRRKPALRANLRGHSR